MDQRIEFCCKALRGGNFRALCREYGISAKTGYKWQERFLRDGVRGIAEESRGPRSHPESMGDEELCRIVGLKLAYRPGAIVDKSGRPFRCSFWVPPNPPDRYPIFYIRQQP
jgi:hypothetical protein